MSDRAVHVMTAIVFILLYVGLVGYSVFGYEGIRSTSEERATTRAVSPRMVYRDADVNVYERRSVRVGTQRGGGIRGGK